MPINRRELLTGVAALAAYSGLEKETEALSPQRRTTLGGVQFPPLPPGYARQGPYIVDGSGNRFIFLKTPDGTQYERGPDGQYLFAPYS